MSQRTNSRSDGEWMELIQECRTSGLSDKEWCRTHSISINTFYNTISRLRKKACEIPASQAAPHRQKQEVVPVGLADSPAPRPLQPASNSGTLQRPAFCASVTVRMAGCRIEIADGASEDTIRSTFSALGRLRC